MQELESKPPYDVSVHLPCFQSQFPAVDDSEIKAMDQQISTLTQQIQNQHDEIKKLETGKHIYLWEPCKSVYCDAAHCWICCCCWRYLSKLFETTFASHQRWSDILLQRIWKKWERQNEVSSTSSFLFGIYNIDMTMSECCSSCWNEEQCAHLVCVCLCVYVTCALLILWRVCAQQVAHYHSQHSECSCIV